MLNMIEYQWAEDQVEKLHKHWNKVETFQEDRVVIQAIKKFTGIREREREREQRAAKGRDGVMWKTDGCGWEEDGLKWKVEVSGGRGFWGRCGGWKEDGAYLWKPGGSDA